MNWRRIAFWFGVLALVDAVLLVAPLGVPGEAMVDLVPRAIVPLLALVAAGYGVKVLSTATGDVPVREQPATEADESMDVARVGSDIDAAFDRLGPDDTSSSSGGESRWLTLKSARMLRSELRRSAITALETRGHSREEAERLVDSGAWTDDHRAAAFLGDEHVPLWMRVRDWASGEGKRRRAEAAVDELLRLTEAPEDDGPVPRRRDRQPADAVFGDARWAGESARTERTADLEAEVET